MTKQAETSSLKMPIYCWPFLIAVFVKQFYILPSGSFQLGDIFFVLSFIIMVIDGKWKGVPIEEKQITTFIILTGCINGLYLVFNLNKSFFNPIMYFAFNLIVIWVFSYAMNNQKFLEALELVLKLALLSQLGILLIGRGHWYEGVRYEGTFNDPNQYGFYVLSAYLMLVLLMYANGKKKGVILWGALTFYLIMQSASTGMLLGFLAFAASYVLFSETNNSKQKSVRLLVIMVLAIGVFLIVKGYIHFPSFIEDSFIYERTLGKLEKIGDGSSSIAKDRNWTLVFNNLHCILYGAGEAAYGRFGSGGEVHSSLLALLWCYGIIPFYILVSWCREKMEGLSQPIWGVYIAIIVETITLVNHRQPMFWMIFVFAGHNLLKKDSCQQTAVVGDN